MGTAMQVEIDCYTAGMLLKTVPLDEPFAQLTDGQKMAIRHYRSCAIPCQSGGLAYTTGQHLTCQEVLVTLARRPGPIYLGEGGLTLREQLAIEHVWGVSIDPGIRCTESCSRIATLWVDAPLSAHYDGENELARQLPLILGIFLKNSWPLDELKQIIEARVEELLKAIREAGNRNEEAPWAKTTDPSGYFIPCYGDIEVKNLIEALFKALEEAKR